MNIFKKLFGKKDEFSLDSSDDPFKDIGGGSKGPDASFHSEDPLAQSTREDYGHGTLTTSKEFTPIGSSTMQTSGDMGSSGGDSHTQDIMQRDMQIISAKLDAIKANVEILSHKVESLEKATIEKKKNTYW